MLRQPFLSFVLTLAFLPAAVADETTTVSQLAEKFEAARLAGNLDASGPLVLPDATTLNSRGSASQLLYADLRTAAQRQRREGREKLEPVRVVSRDVVIHGNSAIVTELLGAEDSSVVEQKIQPRRRTTIWIKSDKSWKIAHLHDSPYSRWEKAITAYEQRDKTNPPKKGGVVFVGSSSIVGWKTLATDFPQTAVIGRGFGGSQVIDSVLYAHRIVAPYKPRAVVVYAGDNDIAAGKSAQRVFQDFQTLVNTIHKACPDALIGFIAIKPSLSRWKLWPKMKLANSLIEQFAHKTDRVDYLDIATPMLGADGMPRSELFVKDGLHLNREGYKLWTSVVKPWIDRQH